MATIGQIVYNIQDYLNSGGYISTSKSNVNETISSASDPLYNDHKIDIFGTNLVTKYGDLSGFIKVGIQAPPGTKAILNSTKTILIGRTGTYELDDDITITSLLFVRPKKYIKDETATQEALQSGITGFAAAESTRTQAIADLQRQASSLSDKEYWTRYTTIQTTYDRDYQAALSDFNMGINGIYKLPNNDDKDAEENYQDLYNVIIDFIYN